MATISVDNVSFTLIGEDVLLIWGGKLIATGAAQLTLTARAPSIDFISRVPSIVTTERAPQIKFS